MIWDKNETKLVKAFTLASAVVTTMVPGLTPYDGALRAESTVRKLRARQFKNRSEKAPSNNNG